MTRKQKRLSLIAIVGCVLGAAVALVAVALRDEIVFFYEPTEVLEGNLVQPGTRFRIGGLVAVGSVEKNDTRVSFTVTDGDNSVDIRFDGLLPDLFREGQGIIAEGQLTQDKIFIADNVLAKHDENYIPKELEDMLKDKDVWKGDQQ